MKNNYLPKQKIFSEMSRILSHFLQKISVMSGLMEPDMVSSASAFNLFWYHMSQASGKLLQPCGDENEKDK